MHIWSIIYTRRQELKFYIKSPTLQNVLNISGEWLINSSLMDNCENQRSSETTKVKKVRKYRVAKDLNANRSGSERFIKLLATYLGSFIMG